MTPKEAALLYTTKYGFSVIPVNGKFPLLKWSEFQERIATPNEIEHWFTWWPDAGVGIVTGKVSGIFVLDIDLGGNAEQFIGDVKTISVKTISGGQHHYFKLPELPINNSAGQLGEHLDIRGEGGFVVAPPSAGYEWIISPDGINEPLISDAPESLLTALRPRLTDYKPAGDRLYARQNVSEGQRNETAASYIGKLLHSMDRGIWETAAWPLVQLWNKQVCKPPMVVKELRATFESIAKLDMKNHINSPVKMVEEKDKLSFITFESLYDKPLTPLEWLTEGLIPINGVTAISGSPGAYKSWFALYIAIQSASGGSFLSGQLPMKKKGILYIDEENGERLLQSRMKSLTGNKKLNIHFSVYGNAKFNEDYIKQIIGYALANKLEVVIFDSFVRFLDGHNENASEDIASIYDLFKLLLKSNLTVIFLHHHKKENGVMKTSHNDLMRGSGDILAQVSSHIILDKKEQIVTLTHNKMREAPELKPFNFSVDEGKDGQITFTHRDMSQYELLGLDTETQKLITATLDKKGRCTVKKLLEYTGVYEKKLRSALGKLESDGMVKSENITDKGGKGGSKKEYFLSELSRLV